MTNYVDEITRMMRKDATDKQRILERFPSLSSALDADELGQASGKELAIKMLKSLGIDGIDFSANDPTVLLDVYHQGAEWGAANANMNGPFTGPARAPAPLPPGVRVPTRNNRLIGEPGFSPGTQGNGVPGSATDSAGDFIDRYLTQE